MLLVPSIAVCEMSIETNDIWDRDVEMSNKKIIETDISVVDLC